MAKRGVATWMGMLIVALLGVWVYVSAIGARLHPNPEGVPSVMYAMPLPGSAAAVERARGIVRAIVSEENLPGLSVAVGAGGEVAWAEGFGYADLMSSAPVTPNHRFRIGTASTALTAAGAGLLVEDGRLKLDEPIQTYVPGFPKKQWPVTLRGLLGDTAGVVTGDGGKGPLFTKHCEATGEALPHFAEFSLEFEPGTRQRFSENGWILVSAAIETAAGQPFQAYVRERVFGPLGMRHTSAGSAPGEADDDHPLFNLFRELIYDPRTARRAGPDAARRPGQDQVTYYYPKTLSNPRYGVHLMRPLDLSCYSGAGAFLSTPSDLARFGMAARRAGGYDGELLGGMVASLKTFPERGMAVAVVSNVAHADTAAYAVKIAAAFGER